MQQSSFKKSLQKIALGAFVLLSFIAYSWHQRHESSSIATPVPTNSPASSTSTDTSDTSANSNSSSSTTQPAELYKDGTYTGPTVDAFYGNVQVRATIAAGKITQVTFLQFPNDQPNSRRISSESTPILAQEAIQAQSAQVDIVSGATDTSEAFVQSLSSALAQAKS